MDLMVIGASRGLGRAFVEGLYAAGRGCAPGRWGVGAGS